jgi:hypothetical protein
MDKSRAKRRYRRLPLQAMVTYRLGGEEYANFSADISADGVFIRTFVPPPVGTPVEVELALPPEKGSGRFIFEAEVVRTVLNSPDPRQNGMGLRFLAARTSDGGAIRALLCHLLDLPLGLEKE